MSEEVLTKFYSGNPKSIDELTLKSFTLKDMDVMFTNLANKVSKVQGANAAADMVKDTYHAIRAKVMENYINEFFSIARGMSVPEKSKEKPEEKFEEKALCASLPVYPGQIICMSDGDRKYRVIDVDGNGKAMLVGLFSIGKVDELEHCYVGSATDSFCAAWFNTLPPDAKEAMEFSLLPNGDSRIVHAPIMKDIKKALDKYNDGCYDWLWENDEDMSSFRVINDSIYGTSVMEGEDGEVSDYFDTHFKSIEVHPCFVINLREYPFFYEGSEERAECKANYDEVNRI